MKNLIQTSILMILLTSVNLVVAQHNTSQLPTSINPDGDAPAPSAILDVQSNNKGVLIPRMTTSEQLNISNPAHGLLIFNTDFNQFEFYSTSSFSWTPLGGTDNQTLSIDETINELSIQNGNSVDLSPMLNKEADYSSYYEYDACPSPTNFTMNVDFSSDAICGNLYDTGGPSGNYGDDEFDVTFSIQSHSDQDVLTRIILHSLDLDGGSGDSLFIGDKKYGESITEPDTFYLRSANIEFISNGSGNAEGFHISWNRLQYQGGNSTNPNLMGFFYNAEKKSIGGGVELDSAWSKVGEKSILFGYGGKATNEFSTAVGYRNEATGDRSNVFGHRNEATKRYSTAIGTFNNANGEDGNAFGYSNDANGEDSNAFGRSNNANGKDSNAFGNFNNAAGEESNAFGYSNSANMDFSSAFGYNNDATGISSSSFGFENSAGGNESNAFGYSNTSTSIASNTFGSSNGSTAGDTDAFGTGNNTNAESSNAFGKNNTTSGTGSNAFGFLNSTSGNNSSAFGYGTISSVFQCMAVGNFNETPSGSSTSWVDTDPAFVIGNGSGFLRSTAMIILKNGNTGIGTTTPTNAQFVVESAEYDDNAGENIAVFQKDNGTHAHVKLFADGFAGMKFVDEGNGSKLESDYMLWLNGTGELEVRNADNADDEFITSDRIASFETVADTYQFKVYGDALASSGAWVNSDRRLKKNIQNLDQPLGKILQLQPKRYDFDNENTDLKYLNLSDEPQIGLIAQEVERVFPELVKTDRSATNTESEVTADKEVENLKAVNYTGLVPVLIGAIQEQQTIIEQQQIFIEKLQKELEQQQSAMTEVLQRLSDLEQP